jgi:hypothetical protein
VCLIFGDVSGESFWTLSESMVSRCTPRSKCQFPMKYGWEENVLSLIAVRFVRLIPDAYLALRMFFGAVTLHGTLIV